MINFIAGFVVGSCIGVISMIIANINDMTIKKLEQKFNVCGILYKSSMVNEFQYEQMLKEIGIIIPVDPHRNTGHVTFNTDEVGNHSHDSEKLEPVSGGKK